MWLVVGVEMEVSVRSVVVAVSSLVDEEVEAWVVGVVIETVVVSGEMVVDEMVCSGLVEDGVGGGVVGPLEGCDEECVGVEVEVGDGVVIVEEAV